MGSHSLHSSSELVFYHATGGLVMGNKNCQLCRSLDAYMFVGWGGCTFFRKRKIVVYLYDLLWFDGFLFDEFIQYRPEAGKDDQSECHTTGIFESGSK